MAKRKSVSGRTKGVEQEGEDLLDLVERIRLATIALRRSDSPEDRRALAAEMDAIDLPRAEVLLVSPPCAERARIEWLPHLFRACGANSAVGVVEA